MNNHYEWNTALKWDKFINILRNWIIISGILLILRTIVFQKKMMNLGSSPNFASNIIKF